MATKKKISTDYSKEFKEKYADYGFAFKFSNRVDGNYFLSAGKTILSKYRQAYDGARMLIMDNLPCNVYVGILDAMKEKDTILIMLKNIATASMVTAISREIPVIRSMTDTPLSETGDPVCSLSSVLSTAKKEIGKESFKEKNLLLGTSKDVDLDVVIPTTDNFSEPFEKGRPKEERDCTLIVKFVDGKEKVYLI